MKKVILFVGALIFMIVVAAVTVPFFVDVDQYRPQIVAMADKQLNGRLELGKLKLSLWGAVKIHAESIKVSVNGFSKPLLNTDKFLLEIPFSSVLSGHPQVIAVLVSPKIDVEKNAQGEMNLTKLMKAAAVVATTPVSVPASKPTAAAPVATNAPATAPSTAPTAAPAAAPTIPAILVGASLGVRIEKGVLDYTDAVAHAKYSVNGLDFNASHVGFASTMELSFTAPVSGATPQMKFEGEVRGAAEITPVLVGSEVRSAKGTLSLDATKLEVEMTGGLFHKTKSMPLELKASVDGTDKDLLIKNLELKFDEYKVYGKGLVQTSPVLNAKFDINTDPLHLERIQNFVPMVAQYGLKGVASMTVNLETNGTTHHANGDLKLSDGEFMMAGMLKAPMHFALQAGFTENSLNLMHANLSAPDSELQLQGSVTNFLAPQFSFSVNGKSFNVDKALVLPEAAPAKKTVALFIPEAEAAPGDTPNPMLKMAANPMVAKASGTITGQIGRITVYNANLESISFKVQLANMLLKIQQASLKTFGGQVSTTGEFELKTPALNYKTQGTVSGVNSQEAFASYFPKYKNTVEGKVNANWNLSGGVYPQSQIMHSLKGTAKFAAVDGALKSVDFQESINSSMSKVPFLKGKNVQIDNGFKSMSADLKFAGGVITADPIQSTPRGKGFEIKGKSTIQENMTQETFFDVFDPQGQLPKEISHPGAAALSLHLTGPISSPKTDYEYTVKRLASNAAKGYGKSALQNLGKSLLNRGGNNNTNGAPAPVQKGISDALKKFGL